MVQELYVWAFVVFFFVALLGTVLYLTLLGHEQDHHINEEAELETSEG